ncbi:hypothetical protein SB748_32690, partial [Rhizobium sp. SIMBA_035]
FFELRSELGEPQFVLAWDCILRHLELLQKGTRDIAGRLFRDNRSAGFSTYGEQYGGVHVNQTLTGIAFGGGGEAWHA